MTKENILEECKNIVDEVCEKYGYAREDMDGNDSLRTVLLKVVPAMLVDSVKEDRELFYQMLRHTPIVVTEVLSSEELEKLEQNYIGNVNPHIQETEADLGKYGKIVPPAAYTSTPIIDENMELKGKKSFLYVSKVGKEVQEVFGTDINVSYLVHELGHAWNSEEKEYEMSENGILTRRVGTAKFKYSFLEGKDGKMIKNCEQIDGLFIEEGMNTIAEEKAMANYLGVSLEEMRNVYKNKLGKSTYQGLMSEGVETLLESTSKQDLEKWRMHGDEMGKQNVENLIEKTESWKSRETILPEIFKKKREIIEKTSFSMQKYFEEHENVFFQDVSTVSPLQKIDNTLEQFYYLSGFIALNMKDNYSKFAVETIHEISPFMKQAREIKVKEEIAKSISDVKASDFNRITDETRKGIQSLKTKEKDKEEGEKNGKD